MWLKVMYISFISRKQFITCENKTYMECEHKRKRKEDKRDDVE